MLSRSSFVSPSFTLIKLMSHFNMDSPALRTQLSSLSFVIQFHETPFYDEDLMDNFIKTVTLGLDATNPGITD